MIEILDYPKEVQGDGLDKIVKWCWDNKVDFQLNQNPVTHNTILRVSKGNSVVCHEIDEAMFKALNEASDESSSKVLDELLDDMLTGLTQVGYSMPSAPVKEN